MSAGRANRVTGRCISVRGGLAPPGTTGKFDTHDKLPFCEIAVSDRATSADAKPGLITRYISTNRDFVLNPQFHTRNGDVHNLCLGNDFTAVAIFPQDPQKSVERIPGFSP